MTRMHLVALGLVVASAGRSSAAGPEGVPSPLPALAPAEAPLTLDQAIDRGMAASHRLAEAEARKTGAEAAVRGREAADRPLVSAQAGYTRTNHITAFGFNTPTGPEVLYPDVPDNLRTRLDVQWPIYNFGRTDALERAARAEAGAVGYDLQTTRLDLKLEITRAFWALATANEAVRVVEESVKRLDAQLEDARNRLKVGLIPPNDVLSVEAQRSRQRVLLIQTRNARDQATADLRRLVGMPPDAPIAVDARFEPPPAVPGESSTLVDEARRSRPERQALSARITGASDRAQAAEANRRPVIAVTGGVDYMRPNPRFFPRTAEWKPSWDAGVNFTWTFLDFGRVAADVAEANASQQAARQRLEEFDTVLEVDVRQRRLDIEAARAAVEAAADGIRSAAEARRVVIERFSAGVATSTDVLDAQVALLQAELDRTQAIANAQLAAARLERALGR
jgi:outer membrane protein